MSLHSLTTPSLFVEVASDLAIELHALHAQPVEACLAVLDTKANGLSETEAAARLQGDGQNTLGSQAFQAQRSLFLAPLKNGAVLLIGLAALCSALAGQWSGSVLMLLILGLYWTGQAWALWRTQKRPLEARSLRSLRYDVKRYGRNTSLPAEALVTGDVLLLGEGQVVPADCRLLASRDLQVDESLLTGESILVTKDATALHPPEEDVTRQSNMVFAGTRIKTGKAEAVVATIGAHTVMGKIAALAQSTAKRETPLTLHLSRVGRWMFLATLFLALGLVASTLAQGGAWLEVLPTALALLVAATPHSLAAVATVILSLGRERLVGRQVVVKNLHALEALGNATVICTDKTGTLTENTLTVHQLFLPGLGILDYQPAWRNGKEIPGPSVTAILRNARLNNTTVLEGIRSAWMGDPIDVALYRAAPSQLERGYRRIREFPFDAATLRSATLHTTPEGGGVSMIKGAPEAVLDLCDTYLAPDGRVVTLSPEDKVEFILVNRELAYEKALRVIGFAEKRLEGLDGETLGEDPYRGATFLGWICLVDPPKPGVVEAIRQCQAAGVRMVMITGDQKATAAVTARELGILQPDAAIWTRQDLLENGASGGIPKNVSVFARTKPEEKLAIVESLQASRETVVMMGDGVNDTPALQKSDIGIAMGLHGCDAAKESADILLLNDGLEGVVESLLESRQRVAQIRRATDYLLRCHGALLCLMALGMLLGDRLPLHAPQILWLNSVTVIFPALCLARQAAGPERQRPFFSTEDVGKLALGAGWMALGAFGAWLIAVALLKTSVDVAATLVFCTVGFSQVFAFLQHPHRDRLPVIQAVGAVLLLQAIALGCPWFREALGLASFAPWLLVIPVGCAGFTALLAGGGRRNA